MSYWQNALTQGTFREALTDNGYFIATGAPGATGYETAMIKLTDSLRAALANLWRNESTRVTAFPPIISRKVLERSGYIDTFPQMVGAIGHFAGGEQTFKSLQADIRNCKPWLHLLSQSDYVLTPAACYHVYPSYSGILDENGATVEVSSSCFRHEPSGDSDRFVSFHQLEFVRIGSAETVKHWFGEAQMGLTRVAEELLLPGSVAQATDPFFGPARRILASVQNAAGAKYELQVPTDTTDRTAVASSNNHGDHFGQRFGIRDSTGLVAHSACMAFGIERLALSLLWAHGPSADAWPVRVRRFLGWPSDAGAA